MSCVLLSWVSFLKKSVCVSLPYIRSILQKRFQKFLINKMCNFCLRVIFLPPLQEKEERYLMLFSSVLIMLSASPRMSGFIYQVSRFHIEQQDR